MLAAIRHQHGISLQRVRHAVQFVREVAPFEAMKLRLLNAIDIYVQSFADAAMTRMPLPLKIPMLP